MEDLERARFSLVYEELFLLQLKLYLLKERNSKTYKTVSLNIHENGLVNKFIKSNKI